ncbi:hypothetical protein AB0I28_13680 [Phytomonospora sp. NPDC050363]|uniref:hypothetical protein n=1 Tax=Phytomonospora sp. NPDC050363 TaxID=3155642 RepID=UPI0033D9E76D
MSDGSAERTPRTWLITGVRKRGAMEILTPPPTSKAPAEWFTGDPETPETVWGAKVGDDEYNGPRERPSQGG